jgi:hypothetical protein
MARRLHLHIGPPKTGTSFLQAAWFRHRVELAAHGVLYPGDEPMDQFRASAVVLGKGRVTRRMPSAHLTAWTRLTGAIRDWNGDAILSSEHYALAGPDRARAILEQVAGLADEVHLLVTARDLARQVPAAWQQSVKQGNDETFDEYWRGLAAEPGRGFWQAQDLPRLLDRWTTGIPSERVHLVVHGAPGSSRDLLWQRVCQVTGVDPGILRPVDRTNESLGVVQIEFLRRVNARLPTDRDRIEMGRLTKSSVSTQVLAPSGEAIAMAVPEAAWTWLQERSRDVVAELSGRDYDVVGDLDDLLPAERRSSGRSPDSVDDAELVDVAATAFAGMLVRDLEHVRTERRMKERLTVLRKAEHPTSPRRLPALARSARRRLARWRRRAAALATERPSH